jgi:hypothetical protein
MYQIVFKSMQKIVAVMNAFHSNLTFHLFIIGIYLLYL